MNKRRWLWLGLSLIAVAFAVVVLISSLPSLLEARLKTQLAGYGVTEFALGEPYWGLTGAGTTTLRISGAYEQWRYRVDLNQVQADYSWRTLIDGEVTAVSVGAAVVDLQDDGSASEPAGDIALAELVQTLALLELPLAVVRVDNLQLKFKNPTRAALISGHDLVLSSPEKSVTGQLAVQLLSEEADNFPQLRITARPGPLSWIPDLHLELLHQGTLTAAGDLALSPSSAENRDQFPFRVNFSLALDDQPVKNLLAPLPNDTTTSLLADTHLALSAAGEVALPALLDLAQEEWYLALPFVGKVETHFRGAVAEYGLTAIDLLAGAELTGTGAALTLTLPAPVQFQLDVDGAVAGLPEELRGDNGILGVTGQLELAAPLVIADGNLGAVHVNPHIQLLRPTTVFEQLAIDGQFEFSQTEDAVAVIPLAPIKIQGRIVPGTLAAVSDFAGWPADKAGSLKIESSPSNGFRFSKADSRLTLDSAMTLAVELAADGAPHALTGDIAISSLSYQGESAAVIFESNLQLPYQGKQLPPLQLKGDVKGGADSWKIATSLAVPAWKLTGDSHIDAPKSAVATVTGNLHLAELPAILPDLATFELLPMALSLASGNADVQYRIRLPEGKSPTIGLTFKTGNLVGIAEGVAFDKATVSGGLNIKQQWSTSAPLEISIGELSPGVVVSDVQVSAALLPSADLGQSKWRLNSVSGKLFNGQFQLKESAEVDFPFAGNRITLALSNLQLGDVLALYSEQGVSGHGVLNGEIPLILDKDGVRVEQGTLVGQAPGGRIALASESSRALGQSHEQLAMTMRLLEDFNYQVLDVRADFLPTGDLTLGVALQGSNPNEFDGRPINFNINFEENIFQLFKVLKLTDDVTNKIEKRLEKKKKSH